MNQSDSIGPNSQGKFSTSSWGSITPMADSDLLTTKQFDQFREIISNACAINLTAQKRMMLSVRVSKRLRALQFSGFGEYLAYVNSPEGRAAELVHLVDVVTTNKTDFFREAHHFDRLTMYLDEQMKKRPQPSEPVRIWSAGCSTGEEPYTLAIVLAEYFGGKLDRFRILATDISTTAIQKGIRAIYRDEDIEPVPKLLRKKYLLRGDGKWQGYWRVSPEIRKTIQFGLLNFNDASFGIPYVMDAVFCRNVIIYFSEVTQRQVIAKLSEQLVPSGLLFIGHSETLYNLSHSFELVDHTVYRKR